MYISVNIFFNISFKVLIFYMNVIFIKTNRIYSRLHSSIHSVSPRKTRTVVMGKIHEI